MTTPSVPAAGLVQAFFVDFLLNQKHASPRTLATYRDAFRLLLRFVHETHGVEPAALSVENLDAPIILAFLDHIEKQRANCIRSRNARLAAIRSFFRFVQMREPAALAVASRVLAIPVKRTERKLVGYLTRPEIDAVLLAPIERIGMVVATTPCCSLCTTAALAFLRSPRSAVVILSLMRQPR